MSGVICGRCGNYTAPGSTYCPVDRWTLLIDVPLSGPSASALDSIEMPGGMGGFWARRNQEKERVQIEKNIEARANSRMFTLEEQVQNDPTDFEAQRGLGLLAMLAGHWERANAHFSRAQELNPDDFETSVNFAIVLAFRGKTKASIEMLAAARRRWPDTPLILFNLALAGLQARRPEIVLEVINNLERLWRENPAIAEDYHDEALSARGLALLEMSRPQEALKALDRAARHIVSTHSTATTSPDGEPEAQDEPPEDELQIISDKPQADELITPLDGEGTLLEGKGAEADLLNNLALAEAALGDVDKAITRLGAAFRLDPTHTRVLNNLAVLSYQQGQFRNAQRYLDLARHIEAEIEKPDVTTFNHLGVVLSALGKLDEALEYFQLAGNHEQAEFEVFYNLGRAFIEHGKPENGVEHLKQAFQLNPNHADMHVVLGAAYLLRGKEQLLPQALSHLKKALQVDPNHRLALADLAMTLLEMDNMAAAIKVLEQAVRVHPKGTEIMFLLGLLNINRGQGNDFANAATQFGTALDSRPELIASLYNVALAQYLMGFRDTSAQLLERVTERDSSFAPAYYLIGIGHASAQRFDQALLAWGRALHFEPGNPELQANIAYIHYNRQNWKLAIHHYKIAVESNPRDSDVLASLGLTYARNDQFNLAIAALSKSLEINPVSAVTHSNLGLAFYLHKDVERAVEHWRMVSQIDANYASRREEEQQRSFDDSFISLRPFNWRARIVKLAPVLPRPHTRLQPGYNARAYRFAMSEPYYKELQELYHDLEAINRSLALKTAKLG